MIQHSMAFDVQLALARITRLPVHTRELDQSEVRYVIGYVWGLTLNEDELEHLWDAIEQESILRERFDAMKATALRHEPFRRQG